MRCDQYGMNKHPKIPKNHNKFSFNLTAEAVLIAAQKLQISLGFQCENNGKGCIDTCLQDRDGDFLEVLLTFTT
jgi:hypothetical protein